MHVLLLFLWILAQLKVDRLLLYWKKIVDNMRADIEESATKKNQQDLSPWHSKEPVGCSFL